jgi:hypothetical protein
MSNHDGPKAVKAGSSVIPPTMNCVWSIPAKGVRPPQGSTMHNTPGPATRNTAASSTVTTIPQRHQNPQRRGRWRGTIAASSTRVRGEIGRHFHILFGFSFLLQHVPTSGTM